MNATPQVTVIGAGIVGASSAAWLARAGFTVALIDSGPVGEGASFGNAGNLSPGGVVPYAMPEVLREAPAWLLDPRGPLSVRPLYLPKLMPWLVAAGRASTAESALRVSRAMHALHRGTLEAYDALTRDTEAAALIDRCGQLYVSEKPDAAQGSGLTQSMRAAAGVRTVVLSEQEIRELVPALAPVFRSGMLLPDNARLKDPHRMVRLIAQDAERRGTTVLRGEATDFVTNGRRVTGIVVDGRTIAVERVVIAAGAASGRLTARLGLPLPLEAERGYHVTLTRPGFMPRIPVTHVDAKFVASPMDVGLRFAGTAEFAGLDSAPNWKRADLLIEQAQRMFPGIATEPATRWAGNRPSLPDGLPVLGVAPNHDNVFLAFGNSHFGMTAGPVMGQAVAGLIAGRTPAFGIEPFSPTRFSRG